MLMKPSHKSHNATERYPTMHHFVTEICTRAQFCHNIMAHCGIWARFIVGFVRQVYCYMFSCSCSKGNWCWALISAVLTLAGFRTRSRVVNYLRRHCDVTVLIINFSERTNPTVDADISVCQAYATFKKNWNNRMYMMLIYIPVKL